MEPIYAVPKVFWSPQVLEKQSYESMLKDALLINKILLIADNKHNKVVLENKELRKTEVLGLRFSWSVFK